MNPLENLILCLVAFSNLKPPVPLPSCMEDELPQVLITLDRDGRIKAEIIIAGNDASERVAREWLRRHKIGQEAKNGE